MRKQLATIGAKGASALTRFGRFGGGSALPGLVAERIDPKILTGLTAGLRHGSILVTGTNGKTTTSRMIAEILEVSGYSMVHNRAGSNLSRGIISALLSKASLGGRVEADFGLFEVDEATMPKVAALLNARIIVVTNLFRDQLDRYGELDKTAALIGSAIAATDAEVYLNADDPLVASLGRYMRDPAKLHYFGITATVPETTLFSQTADSQHCPLCGASLKYKQIYYAHLGDYICPRGDMARPPLDVALEELVVSSDRTIRFRARFGADRLDIKLPLPGLYNAYNALAALAVSHGLGLNPVKALKGLGQVKGIFGRVERVWAEGRELFLLLVKNPAGFNQMIQTFLLTADRPNLLILINDGLADGRDVSWLWDVNFEALVGHVGQILVAGTRAQDMALRLKYAGLEGKVVEVAGGLKELVKLTPEGERAYVLPTYTALLGLKHQLRRVFKIKGRQ